ncbi:GNAT family N-acetyltransferase [Rhizobium rhizosphaerae]|uniref:GNAT family N-acetyltransferase n=1 Tax=Xaviernesmea rhizosphaerae TaxID=1672749 RepID=A0ABX3PBT4_9HYPH|nr:GNAT family N-acetyltransferase [Xaviernesmea rhizosphaerae]OQP85409.1 GNAT family N-acetyltransferase [Xaviernesmea rhizosphaerae]
MIDIVTDSFPHSDHINALWQAAWGESETRDFAPVLARSLLHLCAFADRRLIGFVNVATDGDRHPFLLDTCVHPEFQRQGVATRLVKTAADEAARRGAQWLHVDFEPQLDAFYSGCGFRPTAAGLMKLR